jgi:dienelactone hydrolase
LQVWDLKRLADYLTQREDIDPARIGITGESLGGWLNGFLKHGTLQVMI